MKTWLRPLGPFVGAVIGRCLVLDILDSCFCYAMEAVQAQGLRRTVRMQPS